MSNQLKKVERNDLLELNPWSAEKAEEEDDLLMYV